MRFILILLCLVFLPFSVQAMSCENDPDGIYNYEIVFKGKAVSTKKVKEKDKIRSNNYKTPPRVTRFKVLTKYKGPITKYVDVYHHDSDYSLHEDEDGNKYWTNSAGASINFEMGDVRYLFLNRGKGSDQYIWRPCSPWLNELAEKLPLEKFKAVSDVYEKMASQETPDEGMPEYEFWAQKDRVYALQAKFHEEYNDFPTALEAYRMAIIGHTEHEDMGIVELVDLPLYGVRDQKIGIGRILYKQERYDLALKVFEQIIDSFTKRKPRYEHEESIFAEAKKYRDMTIAEMEKQNP